MTFHFDARANVKIILLALSVAAAGCAATANVVPSTDGTLTAMRRGKALYDSTAPLRLQALKDADDYCAARGKKANVIRSREIPAVGQWPEAHVSFSCD